MSDEVSQLEALIEDRREGLARVDQKIEEVRQSLSNLLVAQETYRNEIGELVRVLELLRGWIAQQPVLDEPAPGDALLMYGDKTFEWPAITQNTVVNVAQIEDYFGHLGTFKNPLVMVGYNRGLILALHHVHNRAGKCLKSRYGPCEGALKNIKEVRFEGIALDPFGLGEIQEVSRAEGPPSDTSQSRVAPLTEDQGKNHSCRGCKPEEWPQERPQ